MRLAERNEVLQTLFDPCEFEVARQRAKPRRSYQIGDPGRRLRRDQRALRRGLRFCGVCQGRGISQHALGMATRNSDHGGQRSPSFYVYVQMPRTEGERTMLAQRGKRVSPWVRSSGKPFAPVHAEFDSDKAWFEIPWFEVRIACWACLGSGFNCSAEMARALEKRCHTQQGHSSPPKEGDRL